MASALGPRALEELAHSCRRRDVRMTHAELASLLGVTRESVSRELKVLERWGSIRLRRRRIELLAAR